MTVVLDKQVSVKSILLVGAALAVIGLAGFAAWKVSTVNSDDERVIDGLQDIDMVRDRIDNNKRDPKFNQRILAALYVRLLQLEGEGGKNALRDSLEAYKRLVDPELKDVSYYTWFIASFCGYERFKELDLDKASSCERMALKIFDKTPRDTRMLTPTLLEAPNVILSDLITRQPPDFAEMHALVERDLTIWKRMQVEVEPRKIKLCIGVCGNIFHEMAVRCERAGDLADAIACYREAANIFTKTGDEKLKNALEERCRELEVKSSSPAAP